MTAKHALKLQISGELIRLKPAKYFNNVEGKSESTLASFIDEISW